jgi:type II secretory pathway pseudopilin PulG
MLPFNFAKGFTLIETVIAAFLISTAVAAMAHLVVIGTRQTATDRRELVAIAAAQGKLEQLRSLTWTYDVNGAPISDFATDTTVDPPVSAGGTGLAISPADSLSQTTSGYVDELDEFGAVVVGDDRSPPAFVRRWAVVPFEAGDTDTLVLQVCVFRADANEGADLPEACVATVRTRRS